jgi:ABC-type multidrug transport system fused ATPase/permease subunit
MVLQDTWLFEGTIGDNIRFNKDDVPDREIWEALKTVGVHHFVKTLPGGLDYVLGDNDTVSQGQKQLLAIARGMIEDAPFLILDEATSGLDPIMQNVFFDLLLEEKKKGTTILYSTHVLNEISKICDRVGFIKDGKIIKEDNVSNLEKENITYLTINSKDVLSIKEELGLKVVFEDDNNIKFINNMSPDILIKKLSKFKIEKLLIEEVSIEDLFIEYYK